MKRLIKMFCLAFFFFCSAANAGNDPSVESEALEIADRLRCLVCSDENIETAQDETAKDMRFFIRRHLTDGKGQDMVVNLLMAQYGDMISLEDQPALSTKNEEVFIELSFFTVFVAMGLYIFRRSRHFNA